MNIKWITKKTIRLCNWKCCTFICNCNRCVLTAGQFETQSFSTHTQPCCMSTSMLSVVSSVRNGCTAPNAVCFETSHIGTKNSNKGRRAVKLPRLQCLPKVPPYTQFHITGPVCLSMCWVLSSLTPWVWPEQLSLISTNGRGMSQPSPSSTRVKDGVLKGMMQSKHMTRQRSLVSVSGWQI